MSRSIGLPLLFALAAVAAAALGAATLNSTVRSGDQPADGERFFDEQDTQPSFSDGALPSTGYRLFVVLYVLFLLVGGYTIYRIYGVELYLLLIFGFVCTVIVLWLVNPPAPPQGGGSGGVLEPAAGNASVSTDTDHPRSYLYLVVVAGIVVASGFLARSVLGDDSATAGGVSEDETVDDRTGAFGAAAGRAADRLESRADPDTHNEVYRAWYEMTRPLSVPRPASSTPAEFADAAVEAGIRREDVDELTRLFEAARYSDDEVTEREEAAAISVLRRIEEQYGGE